MTPSRGPWALHEFPSGIGGSPPYGVIMAGDWPVAEVYLTRDAPANAHLVAAAPDLLDALNAVATVVTSGLHISSESVVFEQVRLALAKAMGEGVAS